MQVWLSNIEKLILSDLLCKIEMNWPLFHLVKLRANLMKL